MAPTDRRQFLAAGLAACACAACPALRAFAEAEKPSPVDVGPIADFKPKGIYEPRAAGGRFFLVSRGGRLYAVSSACTHKQVKLVAKDGAFKCPRHGSTFAIDGRVTKSPARQPLPRYAIRVNENGRVVVDPATSFNRDGWDDPASVVPLD